MKPVILAAILCSGCLSIQADIEGTCVSRTNVEIEGVAMPSVSAAFLVEDMSDVHRLLDFDPELEFVRAEVRPTSGVTDLAFVVAAEVSIEGTPAYACDGNCETTDGVEMLATAKQSATPYLRADQLAVQLTVSGQLPATPWTVDVDVCVRGSASYSISP